MQVVALGLFVAFILLTWTEGEGSLILVHDTGKQLSEEDLRQHVQLTAETHQLPKTHAVVKVARRTRRRDASDNRISVSMNFLGQSHTFQMVPSDGLLSPSYVVEEIGEDGALHEIPSVAEDCYFSQDIREDSMSALTVCNSSVEGMVNVNNHSYVIQPRLGHEEESVIWEVKDAALHFGTDIIGIKRKRKYPTSRKRSLSPFQERMFAFRKEIIEVLVYVASDVGEDRNPTKVEQFVLAIVNIYSRLLQDDTLPQVKLVSLVIESIQNQSFSPYIIEDRVLALQFCQLQQQLNDQNGRHHDYAILLTKRDICSKFSVVTCDSSSLGFAPGTGTICNAEQSCAVIEVKGYFTGFLMAHLTGHALGMEHDGRFYDCPDDGYIMSRDLRIGGRNKYHWSTCSKDALRRARLNGLTSCLLDGQLEDRKQLSGNTTSLDMQCTVLLGNSSAVCLSANGSLEDICNKELWCADVSGMCLPTEQLALDGSECGRDKKCYKGICRMDHSLLVSGGWSSWSRWQGCSHSCGCGVQCRSRECNNPAPIGGNYCNGSEVDCRICNCNGCSESLDVTSILNERCQSLDSHYIYSRDIDNPCKLSCKERHFARFSEPIQYNFLENGFPCVPHDIEAEGRCVMGACISIGCDHVLGSNTIIDVCGVCGGNGSACWFRSETVELRSHFGWHYITTIPQGAREVVVRETPDTPAIFALYSNGIRLVIVGGRRALFGTVIKHGFSRVEGVTSEYIEIPGPLTSSLELEVRGLRTNITYEFRELKNDAVSDSTSLAVTDPEPTVTVVTVQPTLQTCPLKCEDDDVSLCGLVDDLQLCAYSFGVMRYSEACCCTCQENCC